MVQPAVTGLGLPSEYVDYMQGWGLLSALEPYWSKPYDISLQLTLQQMSDDAAMQRTQISADAQRLAAEAALQGDVIRARNLLQVAYMQEQGNQAVEAKRQRGEGERLMASLAVDRELAAMGDQAAAQRLEASLEMEAGLANAATSMELTKMYGSGQLRDTLGIMAWLGGQEGYPGLGSSMQFGSPFVTAPKVAYPQLGAFPAAPAMPGAGYGPETIPAPDLSIPSSLATLRPSAQPTARSATGPGGLYAETMQRIAPVIPPVTLDYGPTGGGAVPPAAAMPTSVTALQQLQAGNAQAALNTLRQVAGLQPVNAPTGQTVQQLAGPAQPWLTEEILRQAGLL